MAEQFRVNEKVRVSVPRNSDVWAYDGKEGIVVHIHENDGGRFNIQVRFDKYNKYLGMNPNNFSVEELEKLD